MIFENRFTDKVCVVTGAASGIGLAIATRLLAEGGTVIFADISEDALSNTLDSLKDTEKAETAVVDITSYAAVQELMRYASERHGQLDVVVNSAGIVGPTATQIVDYPLHEYEKVMSVNLIGSFIITKCALEQMQARGYGRILLLASIAGKDGNPGMAGYTSSKAGVIGLVKGIGKEYAQTQITINGLAPAVIATPMNLQTAPQQLEYMTSKIPMGRLGSVEEVAALGCWIVSDEASFNTGVIFDISGGRATY